MRTERLDTRTGAGRRVAVWRSAPLEPAAHAPVVTISPGFARRMRHVGAVAQCLVANGAVTYRFDSVDHLGLSDGDISAFSIGGLLESWQATLDLARATEGREPVRMVALSLSALAAFRIAAGDPAIESVTALSGVVNGAATLTSAIGTDWSVVPEDTLPDLVTVEGYEVDPRGIWRENQHAGYLRVERTVSDLSSFSGPVANFVASEDPWVDIGECEAVFGQGAGGPRSVIRLPYSGHDLGRNPVAVTAMLERLSAVTLRGPGAAGAPVVLPTFEELLDVRVDERRREAAEQEALPPAERTPVR
jgi:hypothetical protein